MPDKQEIIERRKELPPNYSKSFATLAFTGVTTLIIVVGGIVGALEYFAHKAELKALDIKQSAEICTMKTQYKYDKLEDMTFEYNKWMMEIEKQYGRDRDDWPAEIHQKYNYFKSRKEAAVIRLKGMADDILKPDGE